MSTGLHKQHLSRKGDPLSSLCSECWQGEETVMVTQDLVKTESQRALWGKPFPPDQSPGQSTWRCQKKGTATGKNQTSVEVWSPPGEGALTWDDRFSATSCWLRPQISHGGFNTKGKWTRSRGFATSLLSSWRHQRLRRVCRHWASKYLKIALQIQWGQSGL